MAPFPNNPVFTFGRYKGETHNDIAKKDPGYMVWAYENVAFHASISEDLYLACDMEVQELEEIAHDSAESSRRDY